MEEIDRVNWKEKEDTIVSKEDFLNGIEFEEVSDVQQMLYLLYKEISDLKTRISQLELQGVK